MKRFALALPAASFVASLVVSFAAATPALAAPPWVDRDLTLPRHDWAFDVGLGVGHDDPGPLATRTGVGANFEMGVGLTDRLELGVRGGMRFGDDAKAVHADEFGRLYDRETFNTYGDTFANPEVRLRGALVRGEVFELALEGRVTMPWGHDWRLGAEFGVPMAFHIGNKVRIDAGVYVPVVFESPAVVTVSLPVDVWFQVSQKVWLGPLLGFHHDHQDFVDNGRPGFDHDGISLGFGLGVQLTRAIDFKTMVLFPDLNENNGGGHFGLGAGFQFRIE